MLLPQPILHNAKTYEMDARMEIVEFTIEMLQYWEKCIVICDSLVDVSFHTGFTLYCGGGSSCSSSHCTMFCAKLRTAEGVLLAH